jgi:hypothetical protein
MKMPKAGIGLRLSTLFRLIAVGLLCLLPAACAAKPAEPALKITSSADSASVGQTVTVTLQVENVNDLMAAEMHLAFDPALLEAVAMRPGGFVQTDFTVQDVFDNAAGTIDYAVAQINRPAAQGSGALLVIEFRARAVGRARIGFRPTPAVPLGALLANADGNSVPVALSESIFEIVP